jgi:hypothetical protein
VLILALSLKYSRKYENILQTILFNENKLEKFKVKVKVKVTLVQALRLCTDRTAHRGSRGIALLYRQ